MKPIDDYIDKSMLENENRRHLAGAAIAQFFAVREGLKGRLVDGRLDETAAILTAAVIASTWQQPMQSECDPRIASQMAPTRPSAL